MQCPECDVELPPSAIRPARNLAHCPLCDGMVELARVDGDLVAVGLRPAPPPSELRILRDEEPRAEGESYRDAVQESSGHFEAVMRWFSPGIIFLTFFVIFWDGFLVFWYSIGIATGAPMMMFIFPIVHIAVGVGLTWWVLAGWFNRTRILIEDGVLRIKHGPVPVFGRRPCELRLAEVDMFVVKEAKKKVRAKGSSAIQYEIEARSAADSRVVLGCLSERRLADYLQRKFDKHL